MDQSCVVPPDSRSWGEAHGRIEIVVHVHEGDFNIELVSRKNSVRTEHRGQATLEVRMARFGGHGEAIQL